MTGIERPRELADGMHNHGVTVWQLTSEEYERSHDVTKYGPTIKRFLADIADQIEREHAEDCFRMGGRAADVSMSAYDLLPEDEREAVAWVREHGGLEAVKAHWSGRVALSSVKRMVELHKKKRDRLKAHALWLERKCHERRERIKELDKAIADMRPRLMPEGMEWPRFEGGELVRVGDEAPFGADGTMTVTGVELTDDGHFILHGRDGGIDRPCQTGYQCGQRVKRPAPKVLDADGVEIRDGDTVWLTDGRGPCSVSRIVYADRLRVICDDEKNGHLNVFPESITHRAPVIAADGRPLREGETVYHVKTGREYVVVEPSYGKTAVVRLAKRDDAEGEQYAPDQLTHERPVNHCFECSHWQAEPGRDRLGVCWDTYGERECEDSYAAVLGTSEACAQFVRRAKALAGDA